MGRKLNSRDAMAKAVVKAVVRDMNAAEKPEAHWFVSNVDDLGRDGRAITRGVRYWYTESGRRRLWKEEPRIYVASGDSWSDLLEDFIKAARKAWNSYACWKGMTASPFPEWTDASSIEELYLRAVAAGKAGGEKRRRQAAGEANCPKSGAYNKRGEQ